ncbi:hypothetical protein HR12_12315 [Microbacterium sp. SUBG005]|nr:hypothetical protein HR12_12315 [Microbacterium sp. SUBG005]
MPQHINIGTFDEHPMLGFLPNSVWSMQQDEDTWAEKAFELMQRAIDGEAVNETAKSRYEAGQNVPASKK